MDGVLFCFLNLYILEQISNVRYIELHDERSNFFLVTEFTLSPKLLIRYFLNWVDFYILLIQHF